MSSSSLRRGPHRPVKWNRPVTNRTSENISWIDEHLFARTQVASDAPGQSYLDVFLDALEKSPRLEYEGATFRQVFGPRFLEYLKDGSLKLPDDLSVWLHDVNHDNIVRPYSGRISISQFREVIALKRINEHEMVDAMRRKIHLQNPSPSSLGILALGVSGEQKPVIRDFIRKHLDGHTFIGLRETKATAFVLEFHLPCPVWRRGARAKKDTRSTTDGSLIRNSIDLSFLSATKDSTVNSQEIDFLYESQTSLCVTGWDVSGWTAFSLVDSYFEDETDAEDPFMLASYVKADDEYSEDLDPISVGELTAGKESIKDPREYFLLVSAVRVKRHLEEWTNIRSKLRSRIHGYLSDPHIPLRRRNTNLGTADMDNANVEDSEAWVKQASNQLTILSNRLCKTVDRTKRFVSHGWEDIDVQADEDTSRRIRECLCDISGSIEEMEDVVDGFNDLKSRVKTFEDHLGIHIAVDGGRAIKLQHINVTILQVFSPLALAGTIIQAGIVVGNVYISYAVLTAILFIVTLNLQKTIKWYDNKFGNKDLPDALPGVESEGVNAGNQATRTGFAFPLYPAFIHRRFHRKATANTV